jgi:hypothetical protein
MIFLNDLLVLTTAILTFFHIYQIIIKLAWYVDQDLNWQDCVNAGVICIPKQVLLGF